MDDDKKFEDLVGLIKHLNENVHKWLNPYVAIQGGIVVAVATLLRWDGEKSCFLYSFLILCLGGFAILTSCVIRNILLRNQYWLNHYINRAIELEGGDGFIFVRNHSAPGKELRENLNLLNYAVVAVWTIFLIVFLLFKICPYVSRCLVK